MTDNNIPKIRYIGNSPVLIDKFKAYFEHQIEIDHYYNASKDEPFDYFLVIDPIEQDIKRIRMQELWKRTLTSTPSVKMLVIDWWQCTCNGFVSPMDIPARLPDLLARAVPIDDIKHCKHCHKQMKEAINPLFEPHGDKSPLINVIQPIVGLIDSLKSNNPSLVYERRDSIRKEFQRYEKALEDNERIINETPFKDELLAIRLDITIWTPQINSKEVNVFKAMKEDIGRHTRKLDDIQNNIGFKDKKIII